MQEVTLASGKVSLKKVGSQDRRVKKVLAVQRWVMITALMGARTEIDIDITTHDLHIVSFSGLYFCQGKTSM